MLNVTTALKVYLAVENGKLWLGAEALALLLDGVDLMKGAKIRPWFQSESRKIPMKTPLYRTLL